MKHDELFMLRRSANPYLSLSMILFGVMILQLGLSIKVHSWKPLVAISIIWLWFAVVVFIGTRYRIFWKDGTIVQKAFGKSDVTIGVYEISDLRQETSNVGTLARFRRPFRRVTIYAEGPERKFIDVSLKHFLAEDVKRLMSIIEAHRPDLVGVPSALSAINGDGGN